MALVVLLFAVCVLHSWETQGSSDVTTVFVQKGKDLHLDVKKPVVLGNQAEFKWTVNNTHNIVRLSPDNDTRIIPGYEGRAEFSLQSHTLLLKNVQQNDSGDYTAHITGDEDQRLAEYKVIIQGSSDVTTVFVQKGKDLSLDVKKPVVLGNQAEFKWTVNNTHNIVRLSPDNETRIIPGYERRAEVSLQSHSLLLKNVQQSDSGDYTAHITGDEDQCLAEYKVIIQGSSDVTTVFVQKGKDLHLDVNKPVVLGNQAEFKWKWNNSHNILRLFPDNKTRIIGSYVGRAEVSLQNHSLLLKNVQQNDSGDYTALIIGDNNQRLAEYKVIIQGSSDVTTVFVQKGKDLHLDVKKPVVLGNQAEFKWTVNNTHNIVRLSPDNVTRIIPGYEGRAEVSLQSHSLLLKNVQQSDSGDYTAHITGDEDQHLAEYKVIIQDPVSPVQLSVDSVSNSTESCNLTVSCSTERSNISSTFGCDNQTCYQEGGEQSKVTTSGSTLHIYFLNDYIICNHSNQVSWTKDLWEIKDFCPLNTVPNGSLTIGSWIGIIVSCLVVIFCICFGLFKGIKNQQKRRKPCENTIYAVPQGIEAAQPLNQNATEGASGCTTYSTVGISTRPTRSTESNNITLPETIYSQINFAQ
ncbi:carcinoembryonic antigen-related cell adhesion molecule 1-like isoform X2 [Thunnus thynnus]|uniref:carcinoembryonic antigen-related cell adhesion molecule 1-like isoform X2 n=1 Tax=Thunnus thynnus TaxID=8237 RepID=UPI00352856F9